ncbi:Uncharacterised protein [Legionella sainthelensi]|nr:hypothetical protein [Legionella sainthelensi]VEB38959.1 Uncharacterised protein [Legionella sainthelensi]
MKHIEISEEIKKEMQILCSLINNENENVSLKVNWEEEFDVIRSNN